MDTVKVTEGYKAISPKQYYREAVCLNIKVLNKAQIEALLKSRPYLKGNVEEKNEEIYSFKLSRVYNHTS